MPEVTAARLVEVASHYGKGLWPACKLVHVDRALAITRLAARDASGVDSLWTHHVQTLRHEKQCSCAIEMPPETAAPVPHLYGVLKFPPFDETAALCLPDLLDEMNA